MKKVLIYLIILSTVIPAIHAGDLSNWEIDISLNNQKDAAFSVSLEYEDYVEQSDYFVHTDIASVRVFKNKSPVNCEVKKREIGTSILCEDIHTREIRYDFIMPNAVRFMGDLKLFSYKFPMSTPTKNFSVTVKLPVGYILTSKNVLEDTGLYPYEPRYGRKGSDGRRIFVRWAKENPMLGERIDLSVLYERSTGPNRFFIIGIAIGTIIIMIMITFVLRKKSKIEKIMPVLNDNERKVMKIILKNKKGNADQRKITRKLDFSKSKVSRILKDLEERGLIKRIKRGRRNKIKLRKK